MRKKNWQEELNLKINKLKLQLKKLSAQIENDRDENFAEDSSIRLELLDKRDIITQQITKLQDSMNSKSNLSYDSNNTVKLMINGIRRNITIVAPVSADPSSGYISSESPLAKALHGKTSGEVVDVDTPAGIQQYQIV